MYTHVVNDKPDCEGNARSPVPIPPLTVTGTSELPTMAPVSMLVGPPTAPMVATGAIDGMNMQEKPSLLISNSIKGGHKDELLFVSLGVVMVIIDLTRANGIDRSI